jgi:hypothetical protein
LEDSLLAYIAYKKFYECKIDFWIKCLSIYWSYLHLCLFLQLTTPRIGSFMSWLNIYVTGRKQIGDGVLRDMIDDGYGKMADFWLEVEKSRFSVQSRQSSNVEFASM